MSKVVKVLLTVILAVPVLGLIIYCAISGFSVAWHIVSVIGPVVFGVLITVFLIGLLVKVFLPKKGKRR